MRDESWKDEANCKGTDPELFFPARGEANAAAKAICKGCRCSAACLDYALEFDMPGVWGNTAEAERRRIRPAWRRARAKRRKAGLVTPRNPAGTGDLAGRAGVGAAMLGGDKESGRARCERPGRGPNPKEVRSNG